MGRVILVTGGARSGKSSYCQKLAESLDGDKLFLATALSLDDEIAERISRHKESRTAAGWATVEEPQELAGAIHAAATDSVILVDCLTMWVNNLLGRDPDAVAGGLDLAPTEDDMVVRCGQILQACEERRGPTIFVTNDVGLGIVPGDPLSRLYRDLLGRCNQTLAARADAVVLMVAGLPLVLKDSAPSSLSQERKE